MMLYLFTIFSSFLTIVIILLAAAVVDAAAPDGGILSPPPLPCCAPRLLPSFAAPFCQQQTMTIHKTTKLGTASTNGKRQRHGHRETTHVSVVLAPRGKDDHEYIRNHDIMVRHPHDQQDPGRVSGTSTRNPPLFFLTHNNKNNNHNNNHNRRDFFQTMMILFATTSSLWTTTNTNTNTPTTIPPILLPPPAFAYEPDPDPLRESLYLLSRIQEATVQQERFVRKATNQQDLKSKMKLTLLLIEKNYKLVDQIIYCSTFIPSEHLVEATEAGNIAAQELQSAIDYVRNDLSSGPLDWKQKEYIIDALSNTREQLCIFLDLLPRDALEAARLRIEKENQLNMEEFDGDENAGVYNPVILPWKKGTVVQ
jgi:hypothetical protein